MQDYKDESRRHLMYMIWFWGISIMFHINLNGMFYATLLIQTYDKEATDEQV